MLPQSEVERRVAPRYQVAVTAEVLLEGKLREGATRDLSTSGVNLVLDGELSEGGVVHLTLLLTEDGVADPYVEPFESASTVVWCAPADQPEQWVCGLRFGVLGLPQRNTLAAFLSSVQQQRAVAPRHDAAVATSSRAIGGATQLPVNSEPPLASHDGGPAADEQEPAAGDEEEPG